MTREQFRCLPYLLAAADVVAMGYSERSLIKFVECGVLVKVQPCGMQNARFQKKQLAQLLNWDELLDVAAWKVEPLFMRVKAVQLWTGYSENTLTKIAAAGGLGFVKPPGMFGGKFLKPDVAKLLGFEAYV